MIMASKTHQSSSSTFTYDVFLSFRGEDSRKGFTDHLYTALVHNGIVTFRDDEELPRGEAIDQELMKAIENSRISIPIFTKSYASSRWCLQELEKIMECRETKGQTVLPIFLDGASPSDVRNQKQSFEVAFRSHEQRFDSLTVERWRKTLKEAADLSGWNSKEVADGYESKVIRLVVEAVSSQLNITPLDVAQHPIGIDSHVEDMMRLLNVESEDVQSVGICGIGGIGKTTIAKALYNRLFRRFEGISFLDVAQGASQPNGLVFLQNQLLGHILKTGHENIVNVSRGKVVIKRGLLAKKVLLILDNVDDRCQLGALFSRDWFGVGSRIIITTRDQHILKLFKVNEIYQPKEMDVNQSLQLFSKHAFGSDQPLKGFKKLSEKVVSTTGGLPLALEVLGSSLFDVRGLEVWESMVNKLEKCSDEGVQQKLMVSYNGLRPEEKHMFLDVACFFIGMEKELAINIWEGCNLSSEYGLKVLVDKSLVKIGDNNELRMHDQLRDMGREIVRQESPEEPRMRSRLWIHEEVLDVLKNPMERVKTEGLLLNFDKKGSGSEVVNMSREAFASMPKLRLLQLNDVQFEGKFEHLPKTLRWLCWKGCPFESIPSNIHLDKLVVLDFSQSKIKKISCDFELFGNLKVLNLSYCPYLFRTPEFTGQLCIKRLILEGCIELVKVDESIGYLHQLVFLNLRSCSKLKKLPKNIDMLISLEELLVDHTAIEKLPNSIGHLKNLTRLSLRGCRLLEKIPDSVWSIGSLIYLTLGAGQIKEIPDIHISLNKLEVLQFESCGLFNRVPDWIGNVKNLTSLCINFSNITELPDAVGSLEKLQILNVSNCKKLFKLPSSMGKLRLLRHFNMEETGIIKLPTDFGRLESLEELEMACCREFEGFPENFGSLARLRILHTQYNLKITLLPNFFSGLCSLKELNARGCHLVKIRIPFDFGKLSKLETLDLGYNDFSTLPTNIRHLSRLKRLYLERCLKLKFLPELPSSLIEINAKECISMKHLPNLSCLTNLQELHLDNCSHLTRIHVLERMESLRGLYMSGCFFIKKILRKSLHQGMFEHLSYFTYPGSDIPEWFTHHSRCCEVPRHSDGEITGVILCIVLMLTEEVPVDWYPLDASNNTIYIEIVVWRNGSVIFRSQTSMDGFRCTNEDQIYLCHFREEHDDLVSVLKGGDEIKVSKVFIPKFEGLRMKKCGIHMVYKPNNLGIESQCSKDGEQSVYGKLADFFNSLGGLYKEIKMTITISEMMNEKTNHEVIEFVSDIDGVQSVMAFMEDKNTMQLTVRGHMDMSEAIMEKLKEFLGTGFVFL